MPGGKRTWHPPARLPCRGLSERTNRDGRLTECARYDDDAWFEPPRHARVILHNRRDGIDGVRGRRPVDALHRRRFDHRDRPGRLRHGDGEQAPRGRLRGRRLHAARGGRRDRVLPRAQTPGVQGYVRGELQREGLLRRLRHVRRVLPRRSRATHRRRGGFGRQRTHRPERLHPDAPGDVAPLAHHARPKRHHQARGRTGAGRELLRQGRSRGAAVRLLQAQVPHKLGGDEVRKLVSGSQAPLLRGDVRGTARRGRHAVPGTGEEPRRGRGLEDRARRPRRGPRPGQDPAQAERRVQRRAGRGRRRGGCRGCRLRRGRGDAEQGADGRPGVGVVADPRRGSR